MQPNDRRIHTDKISECWCTKDVIVQRRPTIEAATLMPPATREARIRQACQALADTLVAKQAAYGPSAITEAPGGPLNGLAVRIFDKHARFQNLVKFPMQGDGVKDEALADTARDLAGYGIIAGLVLDGQW